MSQPTTQSFEERLRERITTGVPDVPGFNTAFERGHTSNNPKVIFQQPVARSLGPRSETVVPHVDSSVLRGDTGSGQTSGFPHRTEEKRNISLLFEDPRLISFESNTTRLVEHLRVLGDILPVEKDQVTFGVEPVFDVESFVAIAPPLWRPSSFIQESFREKMLHLAKWVTISLVSQLFSLLSLGCLLFGWLIATNLPSRVHIFSVRSSKNVSKVGSFIISSLLTCGALMIDMENIVGRKVLSGARCIHSFVFAGVSSILRVGKKLWQERRWQLVFRLSFPSLPKVSFSFPKSRRLLGVVGQLMVIASIVLFLMTGGPIIRLQVGDWWQQSRVAITGKAAEPAIRQTLTDTVRKPDEVPPVEKQFQLEIPKIGANLRVIPNVDAGDEKAYTDALKLGVAHAAGSGLPGEPNLTNRTVYIFGHTTNPAWTIKKYNSLFYSLKDMIVGDNISI